VTRSIDTRSAGLSRYFEEQVLRKRPYVDRSWCAQVLAAPIRRETQADGRIRYWGAVIDSRDNRRRILRVVMASPSA
jgi:hypothetical protein